MPEWMAGGLGWGAYVAGSVYSPYGEALLVDLGNTYAQMLNHSYETGTRRLRDTWLVREGLTGYDLDVDYGYDLAGNLTSVIDRPTGDPVDAQCYRFDYLRRLTEAWTPSSANCTTSPTVAGLGGPAPYWHGYTYNAVGNQTLTWDWEGHLATVTQGGSTSSYLYDPDGNRLLRREAGVTTAYLPGGVELRLTVATGVRTAQRFYTFGGRTVAIRTGTGLPGVTTLINDHHQTAELAIANTTNGLTQRRHSAFGASRGTVPGWPGDHDFLDQPRDTTGLTHIGAREYDPGIGRFLTVDPVLDPADPQQINAYAYASGNPVTFSDPTGLRAIDPGTGDDLGCPTRNCGAGSGRPGRAQPSRRTRQYTADEARHEVAQFVARARADRLAGGRDRRTSRGRDDSPTPKPTQPRISRPYYLDTCNGQWCGQYASGTCAELAFVEYVGIAPLREPYYYNTVATTVTRDGNGTTRKYREERGFSSVHVELFRDPTNGAYVVRLYGAAKVSRRAVQVWYAPRTIGSALEYDGPVSDWGDGWNEDY